MTSLAVLLLTAMLGNFLGRAKVCETIVCILLLASVESMSNTDCDSSGSIRSTSGPLAAVVTSAT